MQQRGGTIEHLTPEHTTGHFVSCSFSKNDVGPWLISEAP